MKQNKERKRVVIFIVEGYSDMDALEDVISNMYEEYDKNTEVIFTTIKSDTYADGGDITSKYGITPDNIEKMLIKMAIEPVLYQYRLFPRDIHEIIQIVDTDGAYVPEEFVVREKDTRIRYQDGKIFTFDVDEIVSRNYRKAANLDKLSSLEEIRLNKAPIKYSVYYFSSNLDHYLHNKANLDYREKRRYAQHFSSKCLDNRGVFYEIMCDTHNGAVGRNYAESWSYIRSGSHSIKRRTNIDILINKLMANY